MLKPYRKKDKCPGLSCCSSTETKTIVLVSHLCWVITPPKDLSSPSLVSSYNPTESILFLITDQLLWTLSLTLQTLFRTKVMCDKIQFPQPSIFFFSFLIPIKQENGEQEGEMDEEGLPQYSFFRIFQWRLHCLERKRLDQITNAYATEDRSGKVTTGSFPVSRGWGWFQFLWIVGTCHCKKQTNKRKT